MHLLNRSLKFVWVSVLLLTLTDSYAQRIEYKTRDVAVGLNVPWEIRWGYDGWIWFTERAGWFKKVHPETGEVKSLHFEPEVYSYGECGMLGFDFHPDFPDSPFVFIIYTYADSTSMADTTLFIEKIVRYHLEADSVYYKTTIFDGIEAYDLHNGARIVVGPDRKLYISTSETFYKPELSQLDKNPNGKILRLNLDGSIPDDNPWIGSPVWSKGHRNPQGLFFGPDGTLYSSEHGHMSDDEVNIIKPGVNYGWPIVEGFCDNEIEKKICLDSAIEEPIAAWTPTLAVTGMDYYDHNLIPEWNNSILLMTLKDQSLWQLKLDTSRKQVIGQERYRIQLSVAADTAVYAKRLRDVCFSPDGRVFVSTSNIWSVDWRPDRIFEIIRTGRSEVRQEHSQEIKKQNFSVVPNPAQNKFKIRGLLPGSLVELVDQLGRSIFNRIVHSNSLEIYCPGLVGTYYLRVVHGDKIDIVPVIIQ